MSRILAFSGSAREGSFNHQLVCIAARGAQVAGSDVTIINLGDYNMPIFNQDIEAKQGMPEGAKQFKQLLSEHDGFLIASPEYNGACSPLLTNAITWASRSNSPDEVPLSAYSGKFCSIMATAPGMSGGSRGLVTFRMLLNHLGVTVLPEQVAIPRSFSAFNQGKLVDDTQHQHVAGIGEKLHQLLDKIHQ